MAGTSRAKLGIFERRRPETNQGIWICASESRLIGPSDPKRQQPQYPSGLLEPWQCLPLPLKDRQHSRVKRIRRGEGFARGINGKPVWNLLAMLTNPIAIFVTSRESIARQHDSAIWCELTLIPLKQTAADNLRGF